MYSDVRGSSLLHEEGRDWAPRCPPIAAGALSLPRRGGRNLCCRARSSLAFRAAAGWFEALPDAACGAVQVPMGSSDQVGRSALSAQQNHSLFLLRGDRLAPPRCGGAQIPSASWRGGTMLLKTLAALLALILGGVAISSLVEGKERGRRHVAAPDANWVLLDTRAVDLKKDQDRFKVGASQGRFISVMLVGLDRRIDVRRVSIHTDGEPYIDTERLKLEGGERSHPIQFSHEGGVVEHVDISYQLHLGAGGPAKVQLWGLRASPELPKAGAMGPGWAWIGTRSVDLWKEEDRIEVGTSKGHFKALMLVGLDRLINITRVTIDTEGGQPRVDKQPFKLQKGQRSRPIQLSRDGQAVRHVTLAYRLHLGAAGPANVELWGLRAGSEPVPVAVSTPTASSPAASEGPRLPLRGDAGGEETEGAVLFGVHDVGSTDQDVFKLGREYGRFQRLRLRALGAAVELKEVRVVYAGGDPDVLAGG